MTWEEEQQKQLKEKDLTLQKLQQEMLQLRPRIDELQAFLDNSKDTLQGWLKENKKDGKRPSVNCVMKVFYGNGDFSRKLPLRGELILWHFHKFRQHPSSYQVYRRLHSRERKR